jgi:hypothetical protein
LAEKTILRAVSTWNRKLHIYCGLFLLLFLWLFSISGLILNHPPWFHSMGQRSTEERPVELPSTGSDVERARAAANSLGLSGEILSARFPSKPGHFNFRVFRPSQLSGVDVDIERKVATINTNRGRWAQIAENMHTFSGVREVWGETRPERDWIITSIWSISIDAVSGGLAFLVLSSLYMWYQLRDKRRPGLVALTLGCASCAFFIWGLARM